MDKIDHLFFQAYLRVEPNFACMPGKLLQFGLLVNRHELVEVRFIILNGISILLGLAFGLSSNVALRKFLSLFFGIGLQVLMFKTCESTFPSLTLNCMSSYPLWHWFCPSQLRVPLYFT